MTFCTNKTTQSWCQVLQCKEVCKQYLNISAHSRSTTISKGCQKSFSANIDFGHIFVRTESILPALILPRQLFSFPHWEQTYLALSALPSFWSEWGWFLQIWKWFSCLQEEREGAWEEVRRRRRRGKVKPGRDIESWRRRLVGASCGGWRRELRRGGVDAA